MREVANGDTVRVHYTGTFPDGTEFDSSAGREPIELTVGAGQVIAGFESALLGMTEGAAKSITLEPDEAYGPHDPAMVNVMPRDQMPAEIDLEVGTVLQATKADGTTARLVVAAFDDDSVTLDANHVMAGKTLVFELSLVGFVG